MNIRLSSSLCSKYRNKPKQHHAAFLHNKIVTMVSIIKIFRAKFEESHMWAICEKARKK